MIPKFPINQVSRGALIAGGFVVLFALSSVCAWWYGTPSVSLQAPPSSPNLLTLIGQLNGTTDLMLENTQSLHGQVQQVQGKLNELTAQEQVLQKQQQTGQQLAQALHTQEQLTGQGVALMRQILDREKSSVQITDQLSTKAGLLAAHVGQNATTLQQLVEPLTSSAQESAVLNGQLDSLLTELHQAETTFQLFGKLEQLPTSPLTGGTGSTGLPLPLPTLPGLP